MLTHLADLSASTAISIGNPKEPAFLLELIGLLMIYYLQGE